MLIERLKTRLSQPFEWGVNDCSHLASEVMFEVHGVDFRDMLEQYSTEHGALLTLKKAGFDSLSDLFDNLFQRTDANISPRYSLGLVAGVTHVRTGLFYSGIEGSQALPDEVTDCWEVI